MSKYRLAELKKAAEQRAKEDPPVEPSGGGDPAEEEVILSVRTKKRYRNFWVAQAKLQDKTMVGVVNELLEERFGLPD